MGSGRSTFDRSVIHSNEKQKIIASYRYLKYSLQVGVAYLLNITLEEIRGQITRMDSGEFGYSGHMSVANK